MSFEIFSIDGICDMSPAPPPWKKKKKWCVIFYYVASMSHTHSNKLQLPMEFIKWDILLSVNWDFYIHTRHSRTENPCIMQVKTVKARSNIFTGIKTSHKFKSYGETFEIKQLTLKFSIQMKNKHIQVISKLKMKWILQVKF